MSEFLVERGANERGVCLWTGMCEYAYMGACTCINVHCVYVGVGVNVRMRLDVRAYMGACINVHCVYMCV